MRQNLSKRTYVYVYKSSLTSQTNFRHISLFAVYEMSLRESNETNSGTSNFTMCSLSTRQFFNEYYTISRCFK